MQFNESDYIDMTTAPRCFIYFLLDENGEVVYVGQTTRGMSRIEAHYKDKQFEKIYIIPTDETDLDYAETVYILKYTPKYNKTINLKDFIALKKVKEVVRKDYKLKILKMDRIFKMLEIMGVTPIQWDGVLYISLYDANELWGNTQVITDGYELFGEGLDEVFYFGI